MKSNVMSRVLSAVAALALVAGSSATVTRAQSGNSITVDNLSGYGLYHIYLSPASSNYWGPDQLGRLVLESGYHVTLPQTFFSGMYDLKLVDEDGDSCIVPNVRVSGDTTWDISTNWLLNCEFN